MVTDHQNFKYSINNPNPIRRTARWILLLHEYEFDIVDRLCKKHANVNALSRAYEGIGSSCDDYFPNASWFSMETILNEYIEIWNYLNEFKFP